MPGPTLLPASRRETLLRFALLTPALLLVLVLLVLPFGWLGTLSIRDESGAMSLENYYRILSETTILKTYLLTFKVALLVTLVCTLLGYPLAFFIAGLPNRWRAFALLAVVVPFWTSILVRTYAWLVLLQRRGIINSTLIDWGLIDRPIAFAYNILGVVIGMSHILMPFFILPLYATMISVDRNYMRAAACLGAGPVRAFWTVYVPLTLPGLAAGVMLTFVLSLGFYVTPALLGGGKVNMIAMTIERAVGQNASWGVAAAFGTVLLVLTAGLLALGLLTGRRVAGARS